MRIPFINIPRPDLKYFNKLISNSIAAGHYTNFGPNEKLLTEEIKKLTGSNYVVCAANATLILEGVYSILYKKYQDQLIGLPSFSFPATWLGVKNKKIYCPTHYDNKFGFANFEKSNIDIAVTTAPFGARRPPNYIRPNVNMWIVDNAGGSSPDMDKVRDWLDAGADAVIISLHATKTLSACEGGCIIFNDKNKDMYDAYLKYVNFGFYFDNGIKKISNFGGSNHKMSELSAAWALMFIHKLFNKDYSNRKKIADKYAAFCNKKNIKYIYSEQAFWMMHPQKSKDVAQKMLSDGIEVRPYYTPLLEEISDPISLSMSEMGMCLPTWGLQKNQLTYILSKLEETI